MHEVFRRGPRCPTWTGAAGRGRTPPSGFPGRETARSGEGPPTGIPMQTKIRARRENRAPGEEVPGRKRRAFQSEIPAPGEIRPQHKKTISRKAPPTELGRNNPASQER